MRTIHLFILGIVFSLGCWAQQNGGKFVITGEMACDSMRHTQQAITTLYLVHNEDGREIKIDSVQVKDKRFRFEGIAPKYVDAYFITGFDNGSIQIFLEPGTITIAPFDGRFPAGANIGGTPNNDVLCAYKKVHSRSITQSIARMKNAGASLPEHIRNDEKAFYPYQNAIYFANTLYYETEVMRFVKQHLFASATLFIIKYDLFNVVSTKVLERQFLRAVPKQLHSHPIYMDMVNRIKAGNLKVGAPAPDIAGTTPEGKELKLSDLQGKYVLLDFWASWCGPCRREFPYIKQAMAASATHDNFVVLSYSIDDKKDAWTDCIAKNNLTHKNWLHISTLKGWSSDAVTLFNVTAVPRTILLNPKGEVIAFDLRGEEMLIKVKRIMEGVEKYE